MIADLFWMLAHIISANGAGTRYLPAASVSELLIVVFVAI